MTEQQLRAICADHKVSVRFKVDRRSAAGYSVEPPTYIYLSRYMPRQQAQELGYKPVKGGQMFSLYLCPLAELGKVSEAQLLDVIGRLPRRPDKPLNEQEEPEKAKRRLLRETGLEE